MNSNYVNLHKTTSATFMFLKAINLELSVRGEVIIPLIGSSGSGKNPPPLLYCH